jgi:nucleotide-binding universal stress UspA family protein
MTETTSGQPTYHHILVPLDGSDLAAGALPTARALADRFNASIDAIGVVLPVESAPRMEDESDAGTKKAVDELTEHARVALGPDADPGSRIQVSVHEHPAAAIQDCAESLGSTLVCMGTHGRGRSSAFIGSVARSVLERANAPLVAVGPALAKPEPRDFAVTPLEGDELVACVDGGIASERVLSVAAAWARALDLRLTIVTVAEPTPRPVRNEATWHRHHGPNADADAYVANLVELWRDAVPGVQGHVVYDPISAADGMRDYLAAAPTALVALTSRGRTGLPRAVFGSGAANIIHVSRVPVIVVPLGE